MPQWGQTGPSDDESRQLEKRLVINTITGGPHLAEKSWNEMEMYTNTFRYVVQESCLTVEDEAPTKQLNTMTNDIVFINRDVDEIEAPTLGDISHNWADDCEKSSCRLWEFC